MVLLMNKAAPPSGPSAMENQANQALRTATSQSSFLNRRPRHLFLAAMALLILLIFLLVVFNSQAFFAARGAQDLAVHFSVPAGHYDQDTNLALKTNHADAHIYFTTDGSSPTPENGTLYDRPLQLTAGQPRTAVIRAQAYLPDGQSGPPAAATYFLALDSDLPLVSLVIDPQDLWDESSGIFARPEERGREWERAGEIFFYDPQDGTGFQAPAGLRVHGAAGRAYEKKGLRLYFRSEYGQPSLQYPLFPDSERTDFKRLVLHNGGQDLPAVSLSGTLLRNQLVGNLARKIDAFATFTRPVLLFINGELWGVYNLRERIDDRYLRENFQIAEADLLGGFESDLKSPPETLLTGKICWRSSKRMILAIPTITAPCKPR
jgi:hypothetical protein